MSGPLARRGFLRGLAALPLVGGAVTLIGQPTAAAVLATPELLEAYRNWLHMERRMLAWEMAEGDAVPLALEGPHGAVHLVTTLPSRPLHLLGRAEDLRIDVAARDGAAKIAHVPLHGLDEGGRGVLEQMPAAADLQGSGSALGGPLSEATATISAHDLDARMGREPSRDGATLPVRQEVDGASAFEIADDRAIALALEPGEVVDANHADVGWRRCRAPAQEAQQCVNAHRHGQAFGKPLPGSAAQREGDGVAEDLEARRATRDAREPG